MRVLLPLLSVLAACPPPPEDGPVTGDGLFAGGCPVPGQATARVIGEEGARMEGVLAVAQPGDLLLMNEHAAFVITQPGSESTYWYYGGALADGAALDGCTQVTEDLVDDLGLVLGALALPSYTDTRIRALEAVTAEVIADGSDGGDAIVRVRGTDATHWLVEHTLQSQALGEGGRDYDVPFGVGWTVDYVLSPDAPVLTLESTVVGDEDSPDSLLGAALFRTHDRLDPLAPALNRVSALGLNMEGTMPWFAASDGDGAAALGIGGTNLGRLNISGVEVLLDVDQVLTRPIQPQGTRNTLRYLVALTPGHVDDALGPLTTADPDPLGQGPVTVQRWHGRVDDALADTPVPAAEVAVQVVAPGLDGTRPPDPAPSDWVEVDRTLSDADGRYALDLPVLGTDWPHRLVVRAAGRPDADPVPLDVTGAAGGVLDLTVPPRGTLAHDITDADGAPVPARLELFRPSDGASQRRYVVGQGVTDLPPGTWEVTVSRGWEHSRTLTEVTIPEGGEATVQAVLEPVVDTTGWMSVDTHIHSSPSPDSRVSMDHQLLVAAAHGLDVAMSTDHEVIRGFDAALERTGLGPHIGIVGGLEMTSSALEHMTAFPLQPDGSPQGGHVRWYGLDFPETLQAQRDRGAEVLLLNHPGYLDRIGWDPLTAEPSVDPTLFGLPPDGRLWGWDLDGIEVLDRGSPFADGSDDFTKWMSMLNAGFAMTAVGSSDDHGGRNTGFARTYFPSTSDDPAAFDETELVTAMLGGEAVMSMGAFLRVSVDGAGPGALVAAEDGAVDLGITVSSLPEIGVDEVVVWANCEEAARLTVNDPDGVVKLDTEVRLPLLEDAHLVVAAMGRDPLPTGLAVVNERTPRALSNPIYVDVGDDGRFDAPGGRPCATDPYRPPEVGRDAP